MRLITLIFLVLFSMQVHAYEKTEKFTGIYSSLEYIRESSDVIGFEVFLINSKKGYFVLFQSSEGEPFEPVLIPAQLLGNKLTFTLPDLGRGYSGEFIGQFVKGKLVGKFSNGQLSPNGKLDFVLTRRKSYWQ